MRNGHMEHISAYSTKLGLQITCIILHDVPYIRSHIKKWFLHSFQYVLGLFCEFNIFFNYFLKNMLPKILFLKEWNIN